MWCFWALFRHHVQINKKSWGRKDYILMLQLFDLSSVSHDPSEIILIWWFGAQIFFFIDVEISFVALYFCGKRYFIQDSLMNRKLKRIAFIWNGNIL